MQKKPPAHERWAAFLDEMQVEAARRHESLSYETIARHLECQRHRIGRWARGEEVPGEANRAAIQEYTSAWAKGPILATEWPVRSKARRVRPLVLGSA